ncbi:glycosyltransferase family 2 protein [Xanthobacter sediminis]|uniref:glycosyltransferase family 2 protein n=1 Tax=Xanthobacter sediminis TaxID=3119926 RepID=UPI00372CE55D
MWSPLLASGGNGAGLDRVYIDGDVLVITGWSCGAGQVALVAGGAIVPPHARVEVERPDVAATYALSHGVRGFLCLWRGPLPAGAGLEALAGPGARRFLPPAEFPPAQREPSLDRIAREYAPARGVLFEALRDSPQAIRALAATCVHAALPDGPRGKIDWLRTAPGAGGLCVGWTVGSADFFLVDEEGRCTDLAGALRWMRPDIVEAFAGNYGAGAAEAGFLQALPPAGALGTARLLARSGDGLSLVDESVAEPAPRDPVSYARWAFSLPVPHERMAERLTAHDGALLCRLIACARGAEGPPPLVRHAGPQVVAPEVSLVIPLYGRSDFVDHQLLEFAGDAFIRERCEIIYVVDDPRLAEPVLATLPRWWASYGVPLTVTWGGRNRGFSGASNLGLSLARGRQVLFLNSDVIPLGPGWLAALSVRLDASPGHALLGTRLLFPDGGVQHDGMGFTYSLAYGVYLNDHPGKGLAPLPATEGAVADVPAATGACLIGRREELLGLGGFSEDYLIGDFEDSDLCLKARAAGRRVGVARDIALTHLERQSVGLGESGEFRTRVTLFNAWLHQKRWRPALDREAGHGTQGQP